MSEANETNDMLTNIKEQIMIATHETGEMPSIMKSKKKADSNRGYFYDAQNNILYLKDEQTWNAIKGNLSADLSSDDMGINVSIQPLQGIDGAQGETEEDLQDKIDKINQDSQYEYYRLIKRGDYDCLLCYSFNNVADRDRFAAEMDDALEVGSSDVGEGAKFDKFDDEDDEIDEDFSDDEVLDAPSRRKQNDNGKQNDTQKEKAKVNKKKQKDDKEKKNDDDKKKKDDDDIAKDNEEGEQEVTLVEELGDTLENQTGGTQVNDNSVSTQVNDNTVTGNAAGSGKPAQSIEARFAEVNAQNLPNRYAYLEQYCRIAKEFGEPDGYSLSKNMGNRKAFEVEDVNRNPGHCKEKKLQEMSRENLLMHMLSDILPAITGGEVVHYRVKDMNTLYIGEPTATVNFDSVLNHERVRNSVFYGYFHDLINKLKPLASQMTFTKEQATVCVINFVMNDIGLMKNFSSGVIDWNWVSNDGRIMTDSRTYADNNNNPVAPLGNAILPYDWMRGDDFKRVQGVNAPLVWRLTPRTLGFINNGAGTSLKYVEAPGPQAEQVTAAARIAFNCGDVFPSGDLKRDIYYCFWAGVPFGAQNTTLEATHGGINFCTYFDGGIVNKREFMDSLKGERWSRRGCRDFKTTYFTPAMKAGNLEKLLNAGEIADLEVSQETFDSVENMLTPPIIRNSNKLQNLNSGFGGPGMQPF